MKNITLFIFGGVSQIGGEAKRPAARVRHGDRRAADQPAARVPVCSSASGTLTGTRTTEPVAIVLEWLFLMNLSSRRSTWRPASPWTAGASCAL